MQKTLVEIKKPIHVTKTDRETGSNHSVIGDVVLHPVGVNDKKSSKSLNRTPYDQTFISETFNLYAPKFVNSVVDPAIDYII